MSTASRLADRWRRRLATLGVAPEAGGAPHRGPDGAGRARLVGGRGFLCPSALPEAPKASKTGASKGVWKRLRGLGDLPVGSGAFSYCTGHMWQADARSWIYAEVVVRLCHALMRQAIRTLAHSVRQVEAKSVLRHL